MKNCEGCRYKEITLTLVYAVFRAVSCNNACNQLQ
jgi:hypothetical protein